MTNFLLALNFAAMLGGVVFYYIESGRRREAEDAIFKEITRSLNHEQDENKTAEKILEAATFLHKRSQFHRQLIDGLAKRLDVQETCFAEFGSFIALLMAEVQPEGHKALSAEPEHRLTKLFNTLKFSKDEYESIEPETCDDGGVRK